MVQRDNGKETTFQDLSGRLLGQIDFFLVDSQLDPSEHLPVDCGNEAAKAQIGTQTVFSWPFPKQPQYQEYSMRQDHPRLPWEQLRTYGIQC